MTYCRDACPSAPAALEYYQQGNGTERQAQGNRDVTRLPVNPRLEFAVRRHVRFSSGEQALRSHERHRERGVFRHVGARASLLRIRVLTLPAAHAAGVCERPHCLAKLAPGLTTLRSRPAADVEGRAGVWRRQSARLPRWRAAPRARLQRRRILFLGDSCTNAGPDQYPEKVVALLRQSGIAAEALIAAVGGYSTYQGLQFLHEALAYRPDAVVAYFGWNDYWFAAAGVPDNEFRPLTRFQLLTYQGLSWLRTYQLMHYLLYPPRARESLLSFQQLIEATRVPPRYFVDNIEEMIESAHRVGVPILFVAPPYGAGVTNHSHDVLFPAELIPRIHVLYRELLRATVMRHTPRRRIGRLFSAGIRCLSDGGGRHSPDRCRLHTYCGSSEPIAPPCPGSDSRRERLRGSRGGFFLGVTGWDRMGSAPQEAEF